MVIPPWFSANYFGRIILIPQNWDVSKVWVPLDFLIRRKSFRRSHLTSLSQFVDADDPSKHGTTEVKPAFTSDTEERKVSFSTQLHPPKAGFTYHDSFE
jgi:hypothetical protein